MAAWRLISALTIAIAASPAMPKRSEVDGSSRPTELLVICAARSSWLVCVFAPSRVVTTEMPTDAPRLRKRLSRLDPSVRGCGAVGANALVFHGIKKKLGKAAG